MEEQGSNKSLNILLGVVVFGIFLTITYWFFVDSFRVTIADTLANSSERIKIVLDAGIDFVKGEEGAFEDNLLDTINLPDSLLTLGESAFKKNKFKKATVPITTLLASTAFDNNVKITRK